LVVVLQRKGAQTTIAPAWQAPEPSQTKVPAISLPWQVPGVQTVPRE
jgi:hypothetical protein